MKNLPNIGGFVKEKAVQTITNKVSQSNENNDNGGNTKAIFSSFFDILTGKKNSGEISESANEQTQSYINSENHKEQIGVLRRIEKNTTDISSAIRELNKTNLSNNTNANNSNSNSNKDDGIFDKLLGGIGGLTAGVFALSALPGLVAPDETKEETSLLKNAPTIMKGAEVATDIATTTNTLSNVANVANTTTNATSTMSTLSKVGETLGSFSSAISNNKWFKTAVRGASAGAIGGRLLDGDTTGAGLEATSYGLWEASNRVTNPKTKLGLATASLLTDIGIVGRDWLNKDDKEKEKKSQINNQTTNNSTENNVDNSSVVGSSNIVKSNDIRSFSNEYNTPTNNVNNGDNISNTSNEFISNDGNTLVRNTSNENFSDSQKIYNENVVNGDETNTSTENNTNETVANVLKIGGGLMGMTGVGMMARGLMKSKATSTAVGVVGNVASSALKSGAGGAVAGTLVKGGGKMVGKSIPLLGLGLGAYGAYTRAKDGDYLGAGLEALSGLASTVPVIGTGASLAIQGGLLARDAYNVYDKNKESEQNTFVKESNISNENTLKPLSVNDNLSQGIFHEKNASYEKTQNSALQSNVSNTSFTTNNGLSDDFSNSPTNTEITTTKSYSLQNGMNNNSKETNSFNNIGGSYNEFNSSSLGNNTLEKNYTSSALNTTVYNSLSETTNGDNLIKNVGGSLSEYTNSFIKDDSTKSFNDIGYNLERNINTSVGNADWSKNTSVNLSPNHDERQRIDGLVTKVNHQYQTMNNQDKAMQVQQIQSAQTAIQSSNPSIIPSSKNGGGGVDIGIVTRNPDSIFREVSISIMRRSMT